MVCVHWRSYIWWITDYMDYKKKNIDMQGEQELFVCE